MLVEIPAKIADKMAGRIIEERRGFCEGILSKTPGVTSGRIIRILILILGELETISENVKFELQWV